MGLNYCIEVKTLNIRWLNNYISIGPKNKKSKNNLNFLTRMSRKSRSLKPYGAESQV